MLDRWVNIFFIFTLVIIFIGYGQADDHMRIITALLLAIGVSYTAFVLNWLTLDGTSSAIIFGTIAFGLGGLVGALIVISFFLSASLLTVGEVNEDGFYDKNLRRNGSQVWSNGFWFALWIVMWYLFHHSTFLIAAISSIAMATADTWATEIGGARLKARARLITTGEQVAVGTDGAISFYGTMAALLGSLFIALIYGLINMSTSIWYLLIIIVSGFLGSLVDSYLGARFQGNTLNVSALSFLGLNYILINNNVVNWMATGIASLVSLFIILILGI